MISDENDDITIEIPLDDPTFSSQSPIETPLTSTRNVDEIDSDENQSNTVNENKLIILMSFQHINIHIFQKTFILLTLFFLFFSSNFFFFFEK